MRWAHPSLIFTWVKKCWLSPRFSTPSVVFEALHWNEATYWKSKASSWSSYTTDLPFDSNNLTTPPLIFAGVKKCEIWPKIGLWSDRSVPQRRKTENKRGELRWQFNVLLKFGRPYPRKLRNRDFFFAPGNLGRQNVLKLPVQFAQQRPGS